MSDTTTLPPSTESKNSTAKKNLKKNLEEEHICRWNGCPASRFPSLASLVTHVSNNHLLQMSHMPSNTPAAPIRYSCQWEGCSRFDVEQPSRFALISHCRTHTGEKPYFCPIPECEKHFTRSDALAKHVKGVHDLHQHRDAIGLMKYRADKGKSEFSGDFNLDELTDEKYATELNRDYELRMPWWFSKRFADAVVEKDHTLQQLYDQPLDTRQYDLANVRYKKYLANPDDELICAHEVETNDLLADLSQDAKDVVPEYKESAEVKTGSTLTELKHAYEKLLAIHSTATRVNKIVTRKLADATKEKRRLWAATQILLAANVEVGLPPKSGSGATRDALDENLLKDGME